MNLRLGVFGRAGLEAVAQQDGVGLEAAIEAAGAVYAATATERDGENERPGWSVPRFRGGTVDEPLTPVSLRLEDEQWRTLEGEAQRQGVSLEHVLEHSAMRYLASRKG